jgi:hypothetical protein
VRVTRRKLPAASAERAMIFRRYFANSSRMTASNFHHARTVLRQ